MADAVEPGHGRTGFATADDDLRSLAPLGGIKLPASTTYPAFRTRYGYTRGSPLSDHSSLEFCKRPNHLHHHAARIVLTEPGCPGIGTMPGAHLCLDPMREPGAPGGSRRSSTILAWRCDVVESLLGGRALEAAGVGRSARGDAVAAGRLEERREVGPGLPDRCLVALDFWRPRMSTRVIESMQIGYRSLEKDVDNRDAPLSQIRPPGSRGSGGLGAPAAPQGPNHEPDGAIEIVKPLTLV